MNLMLLSKTEQKFAGGEQQQQCSDPKRRLRPQSRTDQAASTLMDQLAVTFAKPVTQSNDRLSSTSNCSGCKAGGPGTLTRLQTQAG